MKFAHFSDVHIGSWRDPALSSASVEAFSKAIGKCLQETVDFVLISGDFFNTPVPSIDSLKSSVSKLRELKDQNVPVYLVPGSHDFSPSGKTMLDVLEKADLVRNVMRGEIVDGKLRLRFTVDPKTGAKITGIVGLKGMLEKKHFENLEKENLEQEQGFKIFLFHTAVSEFKPSEFQKMDSVPLSNFPKGFDYYAGGHVHKPLKETVAGYGLMTYPGPLFPNDFREVENLNRGGFYIVEKRENLDATFEPINVYNVETFKIDCNGKTPRSVEEEIKSKIKGKEFNETIVTLRLWGVLESGKPHEIDFKSLFDLIYGQGAHFVMKNTVKLKGREFEEVKVSADSAGEIEDSLIKEHLSKIKVRGLTQDKEEYLTKELFKILSSEQEEGETKQTFERRITAEIAAILKLDLNSP